MKYFSTILSISLVISSSISFAQSKEAVPTKNQIGFKLGSSQPMGEFASQNFSSDESAYANQGIAIGGFYNHYFNENIALSVDFSSYSFGFDEKALAKDFSQYYGDSWTVEADPHRMSFIGIGVKFCFGDEKVKGYINPQIGSAGYVSPYYEVALYRGGMSKTEEVSSNKFALKFNFGADVRASRLISLGFNFEYLNAGTFEYETETNYYNGGVVTNNEKLDQAAHRSVFNATFNLGFNF